MVPPYCTNVPPPLVHMFGSPNFMPFVTAPNQQNPPHLFPSPFPFFPLSYNNPYKPSPGNSYPFPPTQPLQETNNQPNPSTFHFSSTKWENRPSRSSGPGESSVEKGKRKRAIYSLPVVKRLEEVYRTKRFITIDEKESLSRELGLTGLQVKVWFQNRRMKDKKAPNS